MLRGTPDSKQPLSGPPAPGAETGRYCADIQPKLQLPNALVDVAWQHRSARSSRRASCPGLDALGPDVRRGHRQAQPREIGRYSSGSPAEFE